jgi:signal transduction histidine kinase
MPLAASAYTLLGLTALVAALVSIVVFALLRFVTAARDVRADVRPEATLLTSVLEEAVVRLKTQERAMVARAEASERLSGGIMASLSAGLLVVGTHFEVQMLNPAGRALLGDPPTLDDYRRVLEEPMVQLIDACLATRAPVVRRTIQLTRPQALYLGVTVSPLIDADGSLQGAICLFTDLTAIRELEEQLRMKEQLASIGELTAGLAHELRNGLATMQGYRRLIDPSVLPEPHRTYVDKISAEGESLTHIVTNFLNLARPVEATAARVDLRQICEQAVEEMRDEVRAREGTIEVRGDSGATRGDEVLLKQAFVNLLRNALEACEQSAVIPAVAVVFQVDRAAAVVRVMVDDNGPGIPLNRRDRAFKPFHTTKQGGSGLGLSLVRKIVLAHDGRIGIATSPLGGAQLQVTLPLCIDA